MDTSFLLLLLLLALAAGLAFILWQRWRSRRALVREVQELKALAEAGRAIAEAQLDVNELCELIYRCASGIVNTSTFQLGLFDGDWYDIRIWVRDDQRLPAQRFDLRANPGLIGWLRESRTPLLVRDFEQERDHLPAQPGYFSETPPRSAVFVPLVARDQAIGTLAIQGYRPRAFTDDHMRRLSIIANQAAAAIANTRLLEQERRRAAHIQLISELGQQIAAILDLDTLFHQTVELVRATFGYYFVAICVREENSNRIVFEGATHEAQRHKHMHVGQGLIGWVVENGELLNVPDVARDPRYWPLAALRETRSELTVPLIFGGETIGALDVESDQPAAFGDNDLYTLRTLADQIAIAIHEARLYAAEREQAWISTALLQVTEATGHAASLEEVLETVVRITPLLSGVERCGVMLAEAASAFRAQTAFGIDDRFDRFVELKLRPGDSSLLDEVVQTGKPIMRPANSPPDPVIELFGPGDVLGLPLLVHGELNGVMWIGASPEQFLSRRKATLLGGIANQTAMIIQNAQLALAQSEEAWVSMALLQVAEAVGSSTNLDEILTTVVRLTSLLVGVDLCAVFLAHNGELHGGYAFGLPADGGLNLTTLHAPLDQWVLHDDDSQHQVFTAPDPIWEALGLQTPIVLPLRGRRDLAGVLIVEGRTEELLINKRRLNILSGIASQTAVAVENVRLMADLAAQQLLEKELDLAREIQHSFLPECCPQVPGYELAAAWRSARRVGGDFYDFMLLANGNVGIAIADVADKGVPAALFMALSRTLVRATSMSGRTPADALRRTNTLILSDARSNLFVTVFYGLLHPRSGSFAYANAGHNPPLWLSARTGEVQPLLIHGMALGVMPDAPQIEQSLTLERGDVLVLYTDGVTEAFNTAEEEFGVERLEQVVRAHAHSSANEMVHAIQAAVDEFAGDVPPFDDFTLVVLKREA